MFVSVFVLLIVGTVTHSTAITPADTRDIVVSLALPSSILPVVVIVQRVGELVFVTILFHSMATTHALTRVILVSVACQSSIDHTPSAVDVLPVIPATGNPVQFVSVPDDGVPSTGVVRVGELENTSDPLPVSSLITPASCEEVVDANCDRGLVVKASHPPVIVTNSSPVSPAFTFGNLPVCPE